MATKYWKTTITAVVLTEGDTPPDYDSLTGLARASYDCLENDASGVVDSASEEVTEEQMRDLLIGQGSDPEFLIQPNEDGH
jgi:hypothetical protein